MKSAFTVLLGVVLFIQKGIGNPVEECCAAKTVGNMAYSLVGEGDVPDQCLNGCIYKRDSDSAGGRKFCFARGQLLVECIPTIPTETTVTAAAPETTPAVAPALKSFAITYSEDGNVYQQTDTYDAATDIVTLTVPPHGDVGALKVVLNDNTMLQVIDGNCYVSSKPDGITNSDVNTNGNLVQNKTSAAPATDDPGGKGKQYFTKLPGGSLTSDEQSFVNGIEECQGKGLKVVSVAVDKAKFDKLNNGELVSFDAPSPSSRQQQNCTNPLTTCFSRAHSHGCWKWSYGDTTISVHYLHNGPGVCFTCCNSTKASDICSCSSIKTSSDLETCWENSHPGKCFPGKVKCESTEEFERTGCIWPGDKCKEKCQLGRTPCGSKHCLDKISVQYFYNCTENGESICKYIGLPCNGNCPANYTSCNYQSPHSVNTEDKCVKEQSYDSYYTTCNGKCYEKRAIEDCNGKCQSTTEPCNGNCISKDKPTLCLGKCSHISSDDCNDILTTSARASLKAVSIPSASASPETKLKAVFIQKKQDLPVMVKAVSVPFVHPSTLAV